LLPKLAVTVFPYVQMRSLDLKVRVESLTENRGLADGRKERQLR